VNICCAQTGLCSGIPQGGDFKICGVPIPAALVDLHGIKAIIADNAVLCGANTRQQSRVAGVSDGRQNALHLVSVRPVRDKLFQVGNLYAALF
jgi:hypothetical protein